MHAHRQDMGQHYNPGDRHMLATASTCCKSLCLSSYLCKDILFSVVLLRGHCWGRSSLTRNRLGLRCRRRIVREVLEAAQKG